MEYQEDMLIPLFQLGDTFLIGLVKDHQQEMPRDSLLVKVDLDTNTVLRPNSGQRYMKHSGYFQPVPTIDRKELMIKILDRLGAETVSEIVEMLVSPQQSEIDTLIWVPDRLR